jgi:hypothetical protein
MKKFRIYVDTSVFGGCFDDEFKKESMRFFKYVDENIIKILLSPILLAELEPAPENVRNVLLGIPKSNTEILELTDEVFDLRESYISNKILSKRWTEDATHVALATIYRADAIVSWNFSHIVRLDKIKMFNQVNLLKGYGMLTIISPKEIYYE